MKNHCQYPPTAVRNRFLIAVAPLCVFLRGNRQIVLERIVFIFMQDCKLVGKIILILRLPNHPQKGGGQKVRKTGGLLTRQCTFQPYTPYVQGGIESVFFALFHNAIPALCGGISELELHGNPGGNIHIAHFFGFQNLEHHNMTVSHRTVVNDIVLSHQRTAFIHQNCFFISHENVPPVKCSQIVT